MKQALITGGARGIGFGVAEAMLAAGYGVTVTGLTAQEVAAVPAREHLKAVQLDVTSDAQVAACVGAFSRLDALVNCAGTILREGREFTIEGFQQVVDVNLTGTMRMCMTAKPLLEKQNGAIVNTASVWSFFGGPLTPAYTASKGGVAQLTKALAVAWAPAIRVNAIAPGWIDTEMTRATQADAARAEHIMARTPFARWGKPQDIGGVVVFLCSENAGFITGTVLPVDGGYMIKKARQRIVMAQDNSRIPYRHPQPKESPPELVIPSAIPDDERVWVPQGENVWFRPLCLCATRGYWMNLLRVRKSGVLSRHRHPQPVHGYVIKGRWRYLEHDWVAQEGGYVYEAPGETHTLVVDEGVQEMITLFQVNGVMIYVDPDGGVLGYEDVFTKIALCRAHYEKVGLGAGFVDQFIR